ncbi:hypothetical protein TNCV_650111 [Trichonephila clavipes]|nr:hypothetical protein TNCV_650111 [Trichonephila clavipes]
MTVHAHKLCLLAEKLLFGCRQKEMDKVGDEWNVTQKQGSLFCIWHTRSLIAIDEQPAVVRTTLPQEATFINAPTTLPNLTFFARLHQRLFDSGFSLANTHELQRRVRMSSNEETVLEIVRTNPVISMWVIASDVIISHMTV